MKQVSNDVVMEVLRTWENWQGKSSDLYKDLGLSKMQLVTMIQKGKRLVKSGVVAESEFQEITPNVQEVAATSTGCGIELSWDSNKVIKFKKVDQLVDFLKKVA